MKLGGHLAYLVVVIPLLCAADDSSCSGAEPKAEGHALLQSVSQRNALSPSTPQSEAVPAVPGTTGVKVPSPGLVAPGSHPILAFTAALDDDGLSEVTSTCCQLEMETYMRKVVKSLNMVVCDEESFLNAVPTYANCQVGSTKFATLQNHFRTAAAAPVCPMVALLGTCVNKKKGCSAPAANSTLTNSAHRRRACSPRREGSKAGDACPLPEGAVWCEVRLKNVAPYWMAVYDWNLKSDWVSKHVCEGGYWDEYDLSKYGVPGHMLDIGGNLGYFTLAFASAGWNISTFEPMAPNLAMINASLCRNPHLVAKVNLNPHGLGSKADECDMVAPSNNLGDGHVQCGNDVASGFTSDPTKTGFVGKYDLTKIGHFSIRRLDQVLSAQRISRVDFVKIDVEGYESQVLAGAPQFLTQYQPRLFKLEVWNNSFGFNGTHFLNQFASAGYHFFSDSQCKVPVNDAIAKVVAGGLWEGFACNAM